MGHEDEKSEDIASPVDQAAYSARLLKMLENIDSRGGQIEARQNGTSAFVSASESPSLSAKSLTHHCGVKDRLRRTVSELDGGVTLNEFGDSGFGALTVFKGRAENTPIGRHSVYESPNLASPGSIKVPKIMFNKFTGEEQYAISAHVSSSEGIRSSNRSRWPRLRVILRGENALK